MNNIRKELSDTLNHFRELNRIRKEKGIASALKYDARETFEPAYQDARKVFNYLEDFGQKEVDISCLVKYWKKALAGVGILAFAGGLALSAKYISDKSKLEGYLLGVQDGTISAVNKVYGTDLERIKMANDPDNTMLYRDRKTGKYHIIDAVEVPVPNVEVPVPNRKKSEIIF